MTRYWTVSTVIVALALATPASAQTTATVERETVPTKWIEVGGGVGMGMAYVLQPFPSLQARLNVTRRTAVEVGTDFFLPGRTSQGIEGMYRLQVHQSLGDPDRQTVSFVTGGIVGVVRYRSIPEYRAVLPTGDTFVDPAHKEGRIGTPQAWAAGGGVRTRVTDHLFLEAGAQLWVFDGGAWVVAHAGLTVPIGRRR